MTAAFSRSLDGGRTLTNTASAPGGDNHDLWIDPTNGDRLAVANDGGFSISVNRGRTWNRVQLPIASSTTLPSTIRFRISSTATSRTAVRIAARATAPLAD